MKNKNIHVQKEPKIDATELVVEDGEPEAPPFDHAIIERSQHHMRERSLYYPPLHPFMRLGNTSILRTFSQQWMQMTDEEKNHIILVTQKSMKPSE